MPKGDNNRKLTGAQRQEIVRLYTTPDEDGFWRGVILLARQFGVSKGAIDYTLSRAGVQKRNSKQAYANGKRTKPIKNLPVGKAPRCKCGCGQAVQWNRRENKWYAYQQGHYRRDAPYKHEDWLRHQYLDVHKSIGDIAKECGVGLSTVLKFMRKFNIPAREQGETKRLNGKQRGANNPAWKGGVTPERQRLYRTNEWRELVRGVFRRDGFCCARCGQTKMGKVKLHAHHIYPFADYPEHRFDPDNLVTLCSECHTWVHSLANTDREYLPPLDS